MQDNLIIENQNLKKKGSKQEVWDGLAIQTSGGLKKEDLILNKKGKIVSKKLSENRIGKKKEDLKNNNNDDNIKEIISIGGIQSLEKIESEARCADVTKGWSDDIVQHEKQEEKKVCLDALYPTLDNKDPLLNLETTKSCQPSESEVLHMENPKRKIRKVIHKEKKEKL